MNTEQSKKLKTFANMVNWPISTANVFGNLHTLDEQRWEDFMAEARKNPYDIKDGEVYGILRAEKNCQGVVCPADIAGQWEYECKRRRFRWWQKFLRAFGIGARCISLAMCVLSATAHATITVSDVEVFSGYPWTEVVVGYTITGTDANAEAIRLTAIDKTANISYTAKELAGAKMSEGRHVLRWNAASEGVQFSSANVVFAVSVVKLDGVDGGVQLWANGPYWAECNVGATKPEDYGYYFWWGDTVGYKRNAANNGWVSVKDGESFSFGSGNCPTYGKDDSQLRSAGYIDSTGSLVAAHDAATQHLGAPWRMPTAAEFAALISTCDTTWTTRNGVYGRLVTGKGAYASKSIFLPAAGDGYGSNLNHAGSYGAYWSSMPNSDYSDRAWGFHFSSSNFLRGNYSRNYRLSVRPLRGFAQSTASSGSVPANTTFVDGSSLSSSMKIDYGPFDRDKVCVVTLNGTKILASNQRGSYTWQPQKTGVNTLIWSSANVAMTSKVNVASLSFAVAPTPNPPMEEIPGISITPTTREIAQTGAGSAMIVPSGSGNWTAAVSDSWITLNSTSGAAGSRVLYGVSENLDVEDRVGYVYVAGYTHTITQKGRGCAVNKTNVEVERDGGKGTVTITTYERSGWKARPNCDWISVSPTSGTGRGTVTYQVAPWYDFSTRSGTITVGGKTITIFQYGSCMELDSYSTSCDYYTHVIPITVNALAVTSWSVTPNASWISVVDAGNGQGGDTVSIAVGENPSWKARTGTVTIGTETFTVTQEGRTALEFELNPTTATASVSGGNGLLAVTATPDFPWTVSCNANWVTVLDNCVSGAGNGNVVYTVSPQNTLYSRTGTITVTPEAASKMAAKTHQVTQPAATSAVSLSGYEFAASGESVAIEVTVNDIVEWKVVESIDWLTVQGATSRVGPGTVTLVAAANDSVYPRSGTLKIAEKTVKVTQPAATSAVSLSGYEFAASGESVAIEVTVNDIVEWKVEESIDWLTVRGATSRVGPGTVTLVAAANDSVYPRSGTLKIAEKTVKVSQKARGVEVKYDNKLFGTDGGMEAISIHPDGKVAWTAVASDPTWIVIYNDSGTGDAEIVYIIAPYMGDGSPRVGWIDVGDKRVYITQLPHAYDLDISPRGRHVTGNAGAGHIAVLADIKDVWSAIATEPWITIVTGYDARVGNGTVRFAYTDNETGKTRVGKIIVAGEVYTLTQAARIPVAISAEVEGHGTVSGAGEYTLGDKVSLEALPDSGYEFLYWTGDCGESMQNPLPVTADVAKSVTAHFGPLTPEFTKTEVSTEGVTLTWRGLAWATQYKIYRAPTDVFPSVALVTLDASTGTTWQDTTGDVGKTYFYWVEAIGADDTTECKDATSGAKQKPIIYSSITYTNLKGATHANPATYQEGTTMTFSAPSAVTGYTFMGWTPSAISATMTGSQVVMANWKANTYRIVYSANGGSGVMAETDCVYDSEGEVAANGFVRAGYLFLGWATAVDGPVVYAPGEKVTNLTSNADGVVTLYAVWEAENVSEPTILPSDGSTFKTPSCTVTISCATDAATIYYSTNGRTPRQSETYRYKGAFEITETTTILALAVKGEKESELVEATITKVEAEPLTLERALDESKLSAVSTGGAAVWTPIEDASAKVGESVVKSGAIGMEEETWLETKVYGKGTLSFWWKVSCEADPRGRFSYDHVTFTVDGVDVAKLDGEMGWTSQSVAVTTVGEHILRWTYSTDDWEESGFQDCAWVDGVVWTGDAPPSAEATQTTEVPVPFAWLKARYPELTDAASMEAKAMAIAANGVNTVWECYVIGLEPTAANTKFEVSIKMVDGEPKVTWLPDLGGERTYKILGSTDLKTWTEVAEEMKGAYNFFKVAVEMP